MDIIPQKNCNKCGGIKPLTAFSLYKGQPRRQCKACDAVSRKNYHERNPEKRSERWKNWHAKNKESRRAYSRKWYAEHQNYYQERHIKQYTENPEKFRERARQEAKTPQGKIRNRINASKHRALERKGDVTADEVRELIARQKCCAYCKKPFTKKRPSTIDHVIPLSRGGQHTISNLVLACKSCNSHKWAHLIYLI